MESNKATRGRKRQRATTTIQEGQETPATANANEPASGSRANQHTTPTTSRKRSKKKEKEVQEERVDAQGNTVRWRYQPTADVTTRMERALSIGHGAAHRLFLVDTEQLAPVGAPGGARQKFAVMGTTGNVYDVHIGKHSSCTCPDFVRRGGSCKHMLFVMMRVLRRSRQDPLVWQKALLSAEADEVLAGVGSNVTDQAVMANERARQRYRELAGGSPSAEPAAAAAPPAPDTNQRDLADADCPICYEPLAPGGTPTDKINTCKTCRNSMHEKCFDMWATQKRRSGQQPSCVYCRAPWHTPAGGQDPSASKPGGGNYINLSSEQSARPSVEDLYGEPDSPYAAERRSNWM